MPKSLMKAQRPECQTRCGNEIVSREPGAMFFAIDSDGDTVIFSGALCLYLDQNGDVVGELSDEREIQLLSQLLSRVGKS